MSCLGEIHPDGPPEHPVDLAPLDGLGHPTARDWQAYRGLIVHLYRDRGQCLEQVQAHLSHAYNFNATKPMFKKRFTKWNVSKYIREQDLSEVSKHMNDQSDEHARPSTIEVNGRSHGFNSVRRSWRRHRARKSTSVSTTSVYASSHMVPSLLTPETSPCTSDSTLTGESSTVEIYNTSFLADECPEHPEKTEAAGRSHTGKEQSNLEELSAVCVATLQTDYHLTDTTASAGRPNAYAGDPCPLEHKIKGYLLVMHRLRDPQELRDLHQVVKQTDVYYQWMQTEVKHSILPPFQCSELESTQARDFYGRYWLGLLLSTGEQAMLGNAFLDQAFDQVRASINEHHPHFLTWVCFVICYDGQGAICGPANSCVAERAVAFAFETSKGSMEKNDPRFNIQKVLNASSRRRELALCLLRQVVDKFHAEAKSEHLEQLSLLAQLFEHVEQCKGQGIEVTLQKWARASQSLARLIRHDRQLQCRL